MKKKLRPHYSGQLSIAFWAAVNRLPLPERSRAYEEGVKLQELELQVLRLLPDVDFKEHWGEVTTPPGYVPED